MLLSSLPGDIPGLVRNGSPCLTTLGKRVLIRINPDGDYPGLDLAEVRLDLSTYAAREHAARWVRACAAESADAWRVATVTACMMGDCVELAESRDDMTAEEIDALARLVLRLAGRSA